MIYEYKSLSGINRGEISDAESIKKKWNVDTVITTFNNEGSF
jgi:hypothetical protein